MRSRAAIALCALAGLAAAAPAAAAPGMEVALQDDPVFLHRDYYERDRALEHARDLGVTRIRVNLVWSQVVRPEPTRKRRPPRGVRYDFGRFDELVDAAAAYGIRLQPTLTGPAPAWATLNRQVGVYIPNPEQYAEFVRAAARHFRGRIDRYALWNEPNHIGWLSPKRYSALRYRALYLAGYRAIREEDPSAEILIGELAPFARTRRVATPPGQFLRELTCVEQRKRRLRRSRCEPLRADGYAHHPYQYERSPEYRMKGRDNFVIGTLDRLTTLLDGLARARGLTTPDGRALDVYLTEFGYFRTGRLALPDSSRSLYLERAFTMALQNPRVRQMLQYVLVDPPADYPGAFFNLSIVGRDGTLMPPFHALQGWVRRYSGEGGVKVPAGPLELPPAPR